MAEWLEYVTTVEELSKYCCKPAEIPKLNNAVVDLFIINSRNNVFKIFKNSMENGFLACFEK